LRAGSSSERWKRRNAASTVADEIGGAKETARSAGRAVFP
jgi:hypothetical protein